MANPSRIEGVDSVDGLVRRHVESLAITWKDTPPDFIKEGRTDDIMKALDIGFKELDRKLLAAEVRVREGLRVGADERAR